MADDSRCSTALGDELHELIETGRLVDAVVPWA
jgi:hypothetical protein